MQGAVCRVQGVGCRVQGVGVASQLPQGPLSLRLKDLLGPVIRVKKKKKNKVWV